MAWLRARLARCRTVEVPGARVTVGWLADVPSAPLAVTGDGARNAYSKA